MNQKQKGLIPVVIIGLVVLILAGLGSVSYFLINKQKEKLDKSLIREEISSFIQNKERLPQEISKIYPNEFNIEEMLQKTNQYVGGMKLSNIKDISFDGKPGYIFMFTGPIKLKGDFYNYPQNTNFKDALAGYTCFDNFSDDSDIKIPYIVYKEEDTWQFPQKNICIKTDSLSGQLGLEKDGGTAEITLNKYVIAFYPEYGIKDKEDLVSPVNIGEIFNKKIIKYDNSDSWNNFKYNLKSERIILTYKIDPKIMIFKDNNCGVVIGEKAAICGIDRSSNGYGLMQYLGGFGSWSHGFSISIIQDKNIDLKEWFRENNKSEDDEIYEEYKINNYPAILIGDGVYSYTIIKINEEYIVLVGNEKNLSFESF